MTAAENPLIDPGDTPVVRDLGSAREIADLAALLRSAHADLASLVDSHTRLLDAEEALRAIGHGEVDALVFSDSAPGQEVFTLSSADRLYRIFVENMQEGAATLSSSGVVVFANTRLGDLLGCSAVDIVARQMGDFVAEGSRLELRAAIDSAVLGTTLEVDLQRPDGGGVGVLVGISRLDLDDEHFTCLTFTDLTSEHQLLNEVSASQQRFEALYKGAPVPAYTWQRTDAGIALIDHNDAATHLTGGRVTGALGGMAKDYYRDDPDQLVALNRCMSEQVVIELATVAQSPANGEELHFQVSMVPVPPDLVVVHTQNVTERWVAERDLRTSEERYRTIVENAQEGISILDGEGRFTFANQGTADLLGLDVTTLVGMEASRLLGNSFSWRPAEPGMPDARQYEVTAIRLDGSSIDLLVSTAPILLSVSGEPGSLCMMSDVSGLREAEEKLAHWALHDVLTGLPNRTLLMDRIDQALTRGLRQGGMVAALFCDLDGFKEVNDSFGHHVGDDVLRAVATRLRSAVRPADTVARIGGDEFVALCEMVDESAAFGIASRVLAAVSEPLVVGGHEMPISVSVGVAFAFSGDAGELLRNADAAMYLAKQRGRNRAELFDEQLRQVAAERLTLIADLRHAAARDELRLHYQPIFSLEGEVLLGVEALVRWQHPQRGLLFPDQFIAAAESANLIGGIGAWVLEMACRQAAEWACSGADGAPLHMAVNVSARQIAQGSGLVKVVADALHDAQIDPSTLVLEVTESAIMDDAEAALTILTQLKGLGVQLAIDDFGTGYSSLVYLKRFPVDQLKVDRSFVAGLGDDPDDSAIVASVVGLARAVGVVAIAEGVETAKQLVALQRMGCALGQGYLWSRALPAADLDLLLRSNGFSNGPEDDNPEIPRTSADDVRQYLALALIPDPDRLLEFTEEVVGRLGSVVANDALIHAALEEVSVQRQQGRVTAADDYLVNAMTEQTVAALGHPSSAESDPLAVVVGSLRFGRRGEVALLVDSLGLGGWRGLSLGCLPWPLLRECCQIHQPKLVAFAVASQDNLVEVCSELAQLREVLVDDALLVISGGAAWRDVLGSAPIPAGIIACHSMADAIRISPTDPTRLDGEVWARTASA